MANSAGTSFFKSVKQSLNKITDSENFDESYIYDYDYISKTPPHPDSPKDEIGHKHVMPSALQINHTLYTLMSFYESNLAIQDLTEKERLKLKNRLHTPEYCYHSHATANALNLWRGKSDALAFAKMWSLTLEKQGCSTLLSEGGEGLLQGLVLSFAGLQFQEKHLELATDADLLHSSFTLHNVFFHNVTLDLSIVAAGERLLRYLERKENSKTDDPMGSYESLLVVKSHSNSAAKVFLCGAGCIGEPIVLEPDETVTIPIYITDPISPILYLSRDYNHLTELGSTLHLKGIIDHAEHLETQRKTSLESRRKIGSLIWISIVLIIILFHIFLFRLIINEYQQWNQRHLQYEAMKPYYSTRTKLSY